MNNKGFTLTETLLTIVLVMMMTAAVAAGISIINSSMQKIQNKANAQVLLSTTVTLISDELKYATEVTTEGGKVFIKSSDTDAWYTYENGSDDSIKGIVRSYYTETINDDGNLTFQSTGVKTQVVTSQAQTNQLKTSIENLQFDSTKSVFKIGSLKVYDQKNTALETLPENFTIVNLNID